MRTEREQEAEWLRASHPSTTILFKPPLRGCWGVLGGLIEDIHFPEIPEATGFNKETPWLLQTPNNLKRKAPRSFQKGPTVKELIVQCSGQLLQLTAWGPWTVVAEAGLLRNFP